VLGRTEALVELGRAEEARVYAERAIERWGGYGCDWGSFELRRALALAEAKLGQHERAASLCDEVLAEQTALGVIGLNLGATYELRTRIALWAQDRSAVEQFGSATAREYRHGRGSPLGARYERLMDEARRAGLPLLPQLSELEARLTTLSLGGREATMAVVEQKMLGAEDADERAYRALRLLCDARLATAGHLFLLSKEGLSLRASHHADRPEPSLVVQVETFLVAEARADEAATAVASSQGVSTGRASAYWIDGGVPYQPVVLTGTIDGVSRPVGVLAVQVGERPLTQISTALLFDVVGTYLATAGDATLP
jgi:hypothetical protein